MLLILIIQLTLPGAVNQGDRIWYHDARSCGLGGILLILEQSPNPATMGLVDDLSVSVSGNISHVSEERGLRVYDSYGNNMGISTISSNKSLYSSPSACGFIFPFHFLRTGFQFTPVWDYNYSFHREYRDDFYQVIKRYDKEYDGRTYALTPMIGITYNWIHAGISQRFMYGTRGFYENIIYPHGPDSTTTSENGINGMNTQCGILITPNMHIRIAYMYQLPYVLEHENDLAYDSIPAQQSVGFMYQPAVRIPTKFLGEIMYEPWDDGPIILYKLGVEHVLRNTYALRYGFCLQPDYAQAAIWTTAFTVGFGLIQSRYLVDIGYAYSKRDYRTLNYEDLGETENLSFNESLSQIVLSFTVHP